MLTIFDAISRPGLVLDLVVGRNGGKMKTGKVEQYKEREKNGRL